MSNNPIDRMAANLCAILKASAEFDAMIAAENARFEELLKPKPPVRIGDKVNVRFIDKRDSISGGVVTDRTTTHARVYKRMSGEAFIDEWFAVSARSVSVQKAN
jgi:hypothetical protein